MEKNYQDLKGRLWLKTNIVHRHQNHAILNSNDKHMHEQKNNDT